MIRSLLAAAALALSLNAAGEQQAAANLAGSFDLVEGDVRITNSAKLSRPAKVGDTVVEGDSIQTGADAEAHLAMEDGGQLGLRPNTRLQITKYKAEGGADDRSVIGLLEGTLRSISGWIGKFNAKSYQIRTPTATIGIRGTDHETKVIPASGSEGEPGTYDRVIVGATLLTTAQGSTEIKPDQAGFVAQFGKSRPKLLDRIPVFFRPARNDKRFDGLHEAIGKRIEQVRAERIKFVRERRPEFEARKREIFKQREQRLKEFRMQNRAGESERRERFRQHREERQRQQAARDGDGRAHERPLSKDRDSRVDERRQRFQERRQRGDAGSSPHPRPGSDADDRAAGGSHAGGQGRPGR